MIYNEKANLEREIKNCIPQEEWINFYIADFRHFRHQKSASERQKQNLER